MNNKRFYMYEKGSHSEVVDLAEEPIVSKR